MKPIKFNKYIHIERCNRTFHRCSYCREQIGKKKLGLRIYKPITNINIWIHINCIDDFLKDMGDFLEKHFKDIMIEELTERK